MIGAGLQFQGSVLYPYLHAGTWQHAGGRERKRKEEAKEGMEGRRKEGRGSKGKRNKGRKKEKRKTSSLNLSMYPEELKGNFKVFVHSC